MTAHSSQQANNTSSWQVYKRLLSYARPIWWGLLLSIIGYLIYSVASTAMVEVMKYLINLVADKQSQLAYHIVIAIFAISILRGVGTFLGKYYIGFVSRFVVHKLRCDIFNKFLNLPKEFYDKHTSGKLIAQLTFDVELVTNACADALTVSMREGFFLVALLSYLLYTSWSLTLVFLVTLPLIALIVVGVSKRFRKLTSRIQKSIGSVNHIANEVVSGFSIVRIFAGHNYERERFAQVSSDNYQQSLKMVAVEAVSVPVIQILVAAALATLVFLAMQPIWLAQMDVGQFTAFVTAAGLLAKPLRQISEINVHIQKGIAAASKLFDQLDEIDEIDTGHLALADIQGEVGFNNVSFAYHDNRQVITGLNLQIKPKQTLAIVGHSGSGKTTLMSLLSRFYLATDGSITIDGHDIQDYTLANLRQHIAVVEQKVTLFHDTIANNIAYGALSGASASQIKLAAVRAYAFDFIQDLPDGFNTVISEDGMSLSGGQRQRIAIARAFLKAAPILILDEATAALDTASEQYIQRALSDIRLQCTTIIIAHRLSTVQSADVIVVMGKNGTIVEQGTHANLLAQNGEYTQLYNSQFAQ
jgi:ATP-binding cassette, subfamily B, bacterial MsbA